MTNVYIAGPMRRIGPPDYNKQEFADAQKQLESLGYTVFNPHECDANKDRKPDDIRGALADDLDWICKHADVLVLLPGWQDSLGVKAELATAEAIGIRYYTLAMFLVKVAV